MRALLCLAIERQCARYNESVTKYSLEHVIFISRLYDCIISSILKMMTNMI